MTNENESLLKIGALAKALIAAKREMGPLVAAQVAKVSTKSGGSYSYTFAELADVYDVCEETLGKQGIAVLQNVWTTYERGAAAIAETTLYHADSDQYYTSGHVEMRTASATPTPQEVGSAITYARRYSLVSAVGLATQDDDGSSASNKPTEVTRAQRNGAPTQHRNGATNGKPAPQPQAPADPVDDTDRARKAFHAAGSQLFGDSWDTARPQLVEQYTAKKTPDNVRKSSNDLTVAELDELGGTFTLSANYWRKWLTDHMAVKQQ